MFLKLRSNETPVVARRVNVDCAQPPLLVHARIYGKPNVTKIGRLLEPSVLESPTRKTPGRLLERPRHALERPTRQTPVVRLMFL